MKYLNNYRKMNMKLIKDQKHITELIQVKWVIIVIINPVNKLERENNDYVYIIQYYFK